MIRHTLLLLGFVLTGGLIFPAMAQDAPPATGTGTTPRPSLTDVLSEAANNIPGLPTRTTAPNLQVPGLDGGVEGNIPPPPSAQEQESDLRGQAFEQMMDDVLPMTPDELREAFFRIDRNQKAIEEPLSFPKPEVAFTTISLDPATEPLTFKLATGHVTTVNFLDVTGQPWPIKDVTWAGNFEVKSSAQGGDGQFPMFPNLLRIIPLSEYAYGNMSIRMYGLATPLTFTLRTNKDVVQYRLDLRIPETGPLAQPAILQGDSSDMMAGDTTLTRIMEGVPPATAEKVSLNGTDGRTSAYRLDGTLYVRTPLTLLSPAWTGSVRSADGMNVYALLSAPVLLLSDQGQMVRATVNDDLGKK
jgi:intracellular multiplication protein IcmK